MSEPESLCVKYCVVGAITVAIMWEMGDWWSLLLELTRAIEEKKTVASYRI